MTGERLPPHDKAVMTNAIVTAKVMAREQHNDSSWLRICSELPEIVDLINSGTLNPECCDSNPPGEVPNYYLRHKAEINSILDPKLESLPDLQATVAAQWHTVIQAAPHGSPEEWRRSLATKFGYSEDDMRRPAGRIRRIIDNIQRAKASSVWRERKKGE